MGEDTELVIAARAGDEDAFRTLVERWFDRCWEVAWRILHDRDLAADVAQETVLTAWQQLGRLEQPGSFGGWVLRISRNRALDRLAKERRAMSTDDEQQLERLASGAAVGSGSGGDAPADAVVRTEQQDLVWAAAAALGERDASLLDLHLRHGLEPGELAEELGITPNAAHQAVFRLRQRLGTAVRAWLLWQGGEPDCVVLGAELVAAGVTSFGPPAVRAINRHLDGCVACAEQGERVTSPAAMFAAVPLVVAPLLVRGEAFAALAAAGVPVPAVPGGPAPDGGPGQGPAPDGGPGQGPAPDGAPGQGPAPDGAPGVDLASVVARDRDGDGGVEDHHLGVEAGAPPDIAVLVDGGALGGSGDASETVPPEPADGSGDGDGPEDGPALTTPWSVAAVLLPVLAVLAGLLGAWWPGGAIDGATAAVVELLPEAGPAAVAPVDDADAGADGSGEVLADPGTLDGWDRWRSSGPAIASAAADEGEDASPPLVGGDDADPNATPSEPDTEVAPGGSEPEPEPEPDPVDEPEPEPEPEPDPEPVPLTARLGVTDPSAACRLPRHRAYDVSWVTTGAGEVTLDLNDGRGAQRVGTEGSLSGACVPLGGDIVLTAARGDDEVVDTYTTAS